MKKILSILTLLVAAYYGYSQNNFSFTDSQTSNEDLQQSQQVLADAFRDRTSDLQVIATGTVSRVLRDDLQGSRHQRFILKMPSGQSLMVAHNIDLAPRIDDLRTGDQVTFNGEYEWNEQGGVIHWTHHDPNGRHIDGWLKHKGQVYQ